MKHDRLTAAEQDIVNRLKELYGSPLRGHHDWDHIEYMLAILQRHASRIHNIGTLRKAVWFHDAVYDTRSQYNEEESSLLARAWLQDICPPEEIDDIDTTIIATKRHLVPFLPTRPRFMSDIAWMIDADLAILGDTPERFYAYDKATRFEYDWVSDEDWAVGRGDFMRTMLDRPLIFHTPEMREERERQARSNIARLIKSLA